MRNSKWIPEIYYEEDPDGATGNLPFIDVPPEEEMPDSLFIWIAQGTGEVEPDENGDEAPIKELVLHHFVNVEKLKAGLTAAEYDRVRAVLGLMPLATAVEKGKQISEKVKANIA